MISMVMAMMLAGGQVAAAPSPAPAPSAEAEALGVKLAENGVLAILLPLMAEKDIGEMIAAHPELSAPDRDVLRATATRIRTAQTARLMTVIGHEYAAHLSLDDLKALVAFNASPAAQHWRATEPAAILGASKALDGFDFRKQVAADVCKARGKLCEDGGK